jgi:hypothetical protein
MVEERNRDGEVSDYTIGSKAENIKNLTSDYCHDIIRGKTKPWIDVYVMNKLGRIEGGKAIYKDFSREVHVAKDGIIQLKAGTKTQKLMLVRAQGPINPNRNNGQSSDRLLTQCSC